MQKSNGKSNRIANQRITYTFLWCGASRWMRFATKEYLGQWMRATRKQQTKLIIMPARAAAAIVEHALNHAAHQAKLQHVLSRDKATTQKH